MTPCEKLGYKVGDKFEFVGHDDISEDIFKPGDILTLDEDDESSGPYFRRESDGYLKIASLREVKKITRDTDTDTDGWIKWDGGECPVYEGVLIDVKYRSGKSSNNISSKGRNRNSHPTASAWSHNGDGGDIIAYRLSDTGRSGSAHAEDKTTNNDDAFAIVNLISSVCPTLNVEDVLEIASTLIDAGFKR